ncbi:MAG: putative ABC transporter permease [Turicibacter sp.]
MSKKHLGQLFYELFWIFFIGCFLGVVIESIWCVLTRGYYESRSGLIYGPFNLIYGFGALLMTIGLNPLQHKKNKTIFFFGFMIGTVFEYICSYFQELWFGTVSWDYSHFLFNLNGRVNLLYSCFWGLLSLAWMKWMYPYLLIEIRKIPKKIGHLLAIFLLIFIIFDSAISALALERQAERRHDVPATTQLDTFLDYHYPDERLLKIYPNMIITSE